MDFSVNGQSQVPPGFRFHPTEEELLNFYLRKKVLQESFSVDVIPYVDLNKLEPWDIQEMCKIASTPQNEWYFFSHKDKKYPTGTRTNRATDAGFWKATGRDKIVHNNVRRIGLRKTLVFYIGRAPCGQKSEWIMYEYRLDELASDANDWNLSEPKAEEGWVVCRLFKKRNYLKAPRSPQKPSTSTSTEDKIQSFRKDEENSENDGDLQQIIRSIIKPCKPEPETNKNTGLHYEVPINATIKNATLDDVFAIHSRDHELEDPCNLSVYEMLAGIEEEFEKELIGHVTKTPIQVSCSENLGLPKTTLGSDRPYEQYYSKE